MDPGDYDTNTLLIDNIASVSFKVYTPVYSSSTYTFAASDVLAALRHDGHLVYSDPVRRAIWCFFLLGKEGSNLPQTAPPSLGSMLEVCGYKLNMVDEGGFEPINVSKSRAAATSAISTLNSASSAGSVLEQSSRSAQSQNPASPHGWGAGSQDLDAKHDPKAYSSLPVKETYEYFIRATLSSLSLSLCARMRAIALSSRSLLLPASNLPIAEGLLGPRKTSATIATFRVYLTTTGAFVISLALSDVDGLMSAAQRLSTHPLPPRSPVLVAPLGAFGVLQGGVASGIGFDPHSAQSPDFHADHRMSRSRIECLRLLETRGIPHSVVSGSNWVSIQPLREKGAEFRLDGRRTPGSLAGPGVFFWPAALCFLKTSRPDVQDMPDDSLDPLADLYDWMMGADEREAAIAKSQKEREAAIARGGTERDTMAQPAGGYSPLALRRQSNSNAPPLPGTMYPTPPDGVQNPAAVMQYLDGTVSSPANATSVVAPAATDIDHTVTQTGSVVDTFAWDADVKRDSGFMEISGGMGADIFGDNDITDADFNFFDDQPGGGGMEFPGITDVVDSLDSPVPKLPTLDGFPQKPADTPSSAHIAPPAPVFAKPELKHARSSLVDDPKLAIGDPRSRAKQIGAGIKRQASPFNAETVFKRVRASIDNVQGSTNTAKRGSVFERVDFDPSLAVNSKKYQQNGRFECRWEAKKDDRAHDAVSPPTTDYLRRHGKGRKLKEAPSQVGALLARITGDLETSSLHHSPMRIDDPPSDADDISLVSDQDDSSYTSEEPASPTKSTTTRRRIDDDAVSLAAVSLRDLENVSSPQVPVDLSLFASNEPVDLSLVKYFAEPEAVEMPVSLSDEDFIMTAQILTEQASLGALKVGPIPPEAESWGPRKKRRNLAVWSRYSIQMLQSALPSSLTGASECRFKQLLEVQEVPLLGPPTRLQSKPTGGTEQVRSSMFQIPPPHFELRRHETRMSLLPPCMDFWESLGLGPWQGTKDIVAVCVFPDKRGMTDHVDNFLDRMRNVYDSLKLGGFDRVSGTNSGASEAMDGMLPYEVDNPPASLVDSPGSMMPPSGPAVVDQMGRLSQLLSAEEAYEKNFVVYFIYTPSNPSSIVECCAAFQRLYELFKKILSDKRSSATNELVMQLIPLDSVALPFCLAIPPPSEYIRLCLETYDRCTLFGGPMPSPAVVLEQPLPRVIDFKLTSAPSTHVLYENSCFHVAYAQSVDERWVTAAWTDNRGIKQMTASYCLGRKGGPLTTPFSRVAQEIWETTQEVISAWKVHWHIIVTKCGPMEPHEAELWAGMQAGDFHNPSASLTLLTVDTDPSLHLIPTPVRIPRSAITTFYTTPVSTPQATMMSPDGNTPVTPAAAGPSASIPAAPIADSSAAEAEPGMRLVEVADATWGAVLSHRLNNSASLLELNPAKVSGYLIKRGGTRPQDPPVAMEVNVVYAEGNPRVHEGLLRDMLGHFRGLSSLARARGMVDRDTDVRPWHVAAAEKGVQVLSQLM